MSVTKYSNQEDYDALCRELGHHEGLAPALLCDLLLSETTHRLSIDPSLVEKFVLNDKGVSVSDEESIADVVGRVYGKTAVELIEKLI